MSGLDWADVADVFADALERPPDDRSRYVEARCEGRPKVRAAVERLLAAREAAGEQFPGNLDPGYLAAIRGADAPVERIGTWRIVRKLGRGGMGDVYLAERADGQFEQRGAVKLLKRGMDSDAILTRFLRERQILAGLDHPNIAHLLDGGIASDNRPYFVLEYVDGMPITTFADTHRLSIDARLDLFRKVCDAVAFAHRNLVVHRDLKPSNVLVTADGRPKLLDFGIAKLLSAPEGAADPTTLTVDGARLMTPAYAAPEQIHGGPVTTSTDVYGLGAVLFELLGGRQPFDDAGERLRMPPDAEPVALSAAVLREPGTEPSAEAPGDIAAARSTDLVRLRRRLDGDLDTIVAQALRADPERRYRSVTELGDDLRRHQQGLPVRARPDTLGYRTTRFVGRHRLGVLAAGVIATLVLTFGLISGLQARAIALERDRARSEAAAAREASEFLVGVFEVADPMLPGHGDSVRATDLLERGAERIEADLAGQPAIRARLLGVIGRAYGNLRRHDRAEAFLVRALDLERATAGDTSAAVVAALQRLARVRSDRGDFAGAESVLRDAIRIQASIAPGDVSMWALLVDVAYAVHGTGDYQRGNEAVAEAFALFGRIPGDAFGEARPSLRRMAELARVGLGPEVADSVFARVVEIERRSAGASSAAVAAALVNWAGGKAGQGEWATADSLIARAVTIHTALDSTSVATGEALMLQGEIAGGLGDVARAVSLKRSALAIVRRRLADDHRLVPIARTELAFWLERQDRIEEVIELRRLANATFRRLDDPALPMSEWRLGAALERAGQIEAALDAFESARLGFERRFPPNYVLAANLRSDYGRLLVDVGRSAEAEPMLRPAIEVLATRWGDTDFRVDVVRVSLGRALTDLGRVDEARELLRAALDRMTTDLGPDDERTRRARAALGATERR